MLLDLGFRYGKIWQLIFISLMKYFSLMNILLIPDKFKGSLSAKQVIEALKSGILRSIPTTTFYEIIASDGGDGFLTAISHIQNTKKVSIKSVDPLGRDLESYYLQNNRTAYIELANCSGLALLMEDERNVLHTSTYGTGLQLKHAIKNGAKKIYVGLGGSATNDGGMGIAKALGYKFFDAKQVELDPRGEYLILIKSIVKPKNYPFGNVQIYAVNDVKNPLTGKNGATMVYGQQKGADDKALRLLDDGLKNLAKVVKEQLHAEIATIPGAGAAGGTAYGLGVFFNATFIPGTQFILQQHKILEELNNNHIDLIITGEGKIDDQTTHGKLIDGILEVGRQYNIPVLAVCGMNELSDKGVYQLGIKTILEIRDPTKDLQYNMENAAMLLEKAIYNYFRFIKKIN